MPGDRRISAIAQAGGIQSVSVVHTKSELHTPVIQIAPDTMRLDTYEGRSDSDNQRSAKLKVKVKLFYRRGVSMTSEAVRPLVGSCAMSRRIHTGRALLQTRGVLLHLQCKSSLVRVDRAVLQRALF